VDGQSIIRALDLIAHPEGGWYRETYRHYGEGDERGALTQIYFLLLTGERSAWHRLDAIEVWHFYAGAPLALALSDDGRTVHRSTLGADLAAGHQPHITVPAFTWQAAESRGDWTLVGCTVAPAFSFGGFELGPADWPWPFTPDRPARKRS
jgi:predicted cupin superfamily sugar epimerase